MKLETIETMLGSANYDFELDYTEDTEHGIRVAGTWIVEGERRAVNYGIEDLYRDCGGEYPCEPCDGGLMVFETECEHEQWLNQK